MYDGAIEVGQVFESRDSCEEGRRGQVKAVEGDQIYLAVRNGVRGRFPKTPSTVVTQHTLRSHWQPVGK